MLPFGADLRAGFCCYDRRESAQQLVNAMPPGLSVARVVVRIEPDEKGGE